MNSDGEYAKNLQQTFDAEAENACSVRSPDQEGSTSFHSLGQLILASELDLTSNHEANHPILNPVRPRMINLSSLLEISNSSDSDSDLSDIESEINQRRPVNPRGAASVRWVFSVNSTSKS